MRMFTDYYGNSLMKTAAALRAQADTLEKQAADQQGVAANFQRIVTGLRGLVAAGKLNARSTVDEAKGAGKDILAALRSQGKAALAAGKLNARRTLDEAKGAAGDAVSAVDRTIRADLAAERYNFKRAKQLAASGKDKFANFLNAVGNRAKEGAQALGSSDVAAEMDKTRRDAAAARAQADKALSDSYASGLITGGGAAGGGVAGGVIGYYLAPEKQRKLGAAIGALIGTTVGGVGTHYGQKYLNS